MSKKLKRPIAFIATLAMVCSMLLYLPGGVMTDLGFGLAVSAEDGTDADDTSTSGSGESTPADTGTTGGAGETPADTDNTDGTGDPTADTNSTPDSTNESAAEVSEPVLLLAESTEGTAHTHAPCGKESCGYDDHESVTYKPFSDAVFLDNNETQIPFNGNTSLDLRGYEYVRLVDGDYYLDADYTINTDYGIYYNLGNICLNGHTLTINTNGDPAIRTNEITICDCSENNSGSLDNNLIADDDILIDKSGANEGDYTPVVIHLFGGNYNGKVRCGILYVYDGANIYTAYAGYANVYGGYVDQLNSISLYRNCILYQYSGKVNWPSDIEKHYDDNHDGICDDYLCDESFWTISKPVNGKAIVKAGDTAEIGGFNSGLNSGSEEYYHISPKYQWYSCDKNGDNKTVIDGASSDKYNAPAAETAGESYYVCGVSFGGETAYSEVITVQTVLNPKRYDVTDGTAVDKIREALLDRSDYIELTLTGSALTDITTENYGNKVKELYNSAFTHITEAADSNYANRSRLGDYIAKSIGETGMSMVCYTSDGTTVSQVVFGYEPEYYTDKSQEEQVTSELAGIYTELALSELSDREKVYKIYSWIVNNVSYDYANLNIDENKTKYTAYGALFERRAVCQGFACLFYRMCLDNGIDCRIVTGTSKGENHAWNIVKVDDYYYYADPTWDCFVIENAANNRQAKPGTFFYFLRGNLVNHTESETENVTSGYTMAGADEYLSAFKAAVVDGTATAVHLDGTALSDAEKTWYYVDVTDGDGCKKNVAVKGKSTIVSDNGLANMELYSGETEAIHSFGTDGFCTVCDSGYQPATLTTDKYDIDGVVGYDEVYEIGNAGQLYWFAQQVNSGNYGMNAELTANIIVNTEVLKPDGTLADVTSGFRSWTPIGNYSDNYKGTFDGANHTISGLYFNNTDVEHVGLFGVSGGTIKNVGVVDSYFNGKQHVGGVCGVNKGTISNCYNAGAVSVTENFVGGVCGSDVFGTITNCYNTGAVSGVGFVGGVCGYQFAKGITNCYNTGAVTGTEESVGGVCGSNDGGIITNCYYLDTIKSDSNATAKTTGEFGSGEVAYLLQGTQATAVWGQAIGADNFPVLGGAKVYKTTPCVSYSNDENVTEKEHTGAETDGICDVCGARTAYIVSLGSQTADGEAFSVAYLNGGGKINVGESTTIEAPAVPGYTFIGWFNGETPLSADLSFVYTPTVDVTFTAKYKANRTMSVTVTSESANFNIAVNNGTSENFTTQQVNNYSVGTVLTLTANGDDFDYWANDIGSVVSRSAAFDYTVVGNVSLTAVFNKKAENKATVTFVTAYDQIIGRKQMTAEDTIDVPVTPVRYGYDFAGWSVNGGDAVAADEVVAEIQKAVAAVLATEGTADDVVMVRPVYTPKAIDITVTVYNGNSETGTELSYNVNDIVTVTAEAVSGMKFAYWTDGTGKILSYNETYGFYATTSTTVKAVYVAEETVVEAKGTTEIVDIIPDAANGRIAFVSLSTVPEGCTIKVAGLIATTDANIANGTFDDTTAEYVRGKSWSGTSYRYTWNKGATAGQTWYVKAYLVYTDKNGNTQTVYGDTVRTAALQ